MAATTMMTVIIPADICSSRALLGPPGRLCGDGPICVRRLPVIPAAPGRLGDRLPHAQEEAKQPYDQCDQRNPPQEMYGEPEPAQDQDEQKGREDHGHGTSPPTRYDARESR